MAALRLCVSSTAFFRFKDDELALQERWYPIQVKQKDKVGRLDIDAFETELCVEVNEKRGSSFPLTILP